MSNLFSHIFQPATREYLKKKNELFRRIKGSSLVQLMDTNLDDEESIYAGAAGSPLARITYCLVIICFVAPRIVTHDAEKVGYRYDFLF